MAGSKHRRLVRPVKPTRVDWGQRIARLLCLLFALVGLVPLSGGLLLHSAPAKRWAASETSRLLLQELGLSATFRVELSLIPLRLSILDLAVVDKERSTPAVAAELIAVSPRFFSLLAGRIDVGDIELENSSIRLNIQDGQVQNIALHVPDSQGDTHFTRAPFRSLAITNVNVDLQLDGHRAEIEGVDLDVIAEKELTFDIALRALGAKTTTSHALADTSQAKTSKDKLKSPDTSSNGSVADVTSPSIDEDRLCALELRAHVSKDEVIVRRLSLVGSLDADPRATFEAKCDDNPDQQFALRLSQFKIGGLKNKLPTFKGHVMAKLPLFAIERASPTNQGEGWAGYSGSVVYDETTRLPKLDGKLSGERLKFGGVKIADRLSADLQVSDQLITIAQMSVGWGNGQAQLKDVQVRPFEKGMPIRIEHLSGHGVDLPGVLRDIDVTHHAWVDWNFGEIEVDQIVGTVSPFSIDGAVEGHTKDFVIWDRGFDDPQRRKMLGIPQASVTGRFRANERALDFYNFDLRFGSSSHVPVDLVSIGFFPLELIVKTKPEGGEIELAELGPIADLTLSGKSKVVADLKGPMFHPVLKGTLQVNDLIIGGFSAGNVEQTSVTFEPLFVTFDDLKGRKGNLDYRLPHARLSFDGPATVEFKTDVESPRFSVHEFLNVFHFDEDPRFADLAGDGKVRGTVRYLLGGPEDRCGAGRLLISGNVELRTAAFLGEEYSGGSGEFSLDWFDIEAGQRGMSLAVPTLTLRKGSGSVFGSVMVKSGGDLSGNFLATQIPLTHIDSLKTEFARLDGFISGAGQLGGNIDALQLGAQLSISELKTGGASFAPSHINVDMKRAPTKADPLAQLSGCGRPISGTNVATTNETEGELLINGELFGSQIVVRDLHIEQKADPVVQGEVELNQFDLSQIDAITQIPGSSRRISSGRLSGKLQLEEVLINAPFQSKARLEVTKVEIQTGGVGVQLADQPFLVLLSDRQLKSEGLALKAIAPGGQTAIIDADFLVKSDQNVQGALRLRPTSLALLAALAPGIKRADGSLSAELNVTGSLARPKINGAFDVDQGLVVLEGVNEAIQDLSVHAEVDETGIHLKKGKAHFSDGELSVKGEVPFVDGSLGQLELSVAARRVRWKANEGVNVMLDADLKVVTRGKQTEAESLPVISGTVDILSASYDKAMSITADISTLTTRGDKTEISGYEVGKDNLELDLLIRSSRPLNVKNELVQATLRLDPAGLRITGTDQRFGAVGTVEVQTGGRIFLRRNEFELKSGLVRFNDPTRLRPEVDVSAVTEYRRYKLTGSQGQSSATDSGSSTVGSGNWRILMHAYGSPENLKVDLTSDPPLAQDDIFLLLTVGLTRTELDQSRNSGVGSSVALEALGTLSGAESAVTDVVPVDEFRFGSTYSSRSGRTEPTVTIGKRLSDRIRASVTTSLSETSEVRSNVEYRATQNLSVEGSFDNASNVASATGGNLGGDVRWRVEFR